MRSSWTQFLRVHIGTSLPFFRISTLADSVKDFDAGPVIWPVGSVKIEVSIGMQRLCQATRLSIVGAMRKVFTKLLGYSPEPGVTSYGMGLRC